MNETQSAALDLILQRWFSTIPCEERGRISIHNEDRWQTIGMIGALCVIVVWTSRTDPENPTDLLTRIISARRAEKAERKIYENGNFEGGL